MKIRLELVVKMNYKRRNLTKSPELAIHHFNNQSILPQNINHKSSDHKVPVRYSNILIASNQYLELRNLKDNHNSEPYSKNAATRKKIYQSSRLLIKIMKRKIHHKRRLTKDANLIVQIVPPMKACNYLMSKIIFL